MPSAKNDNLKKSSYFYFADKVIADNVYNSSNICNDCWNVSFEGLSSRQREKC